ncbi:hypothetical protein [Rhizobium sp. R635]|uniref:hypothetical protein n=1 Tax=Rhizobium sp. BR 249 TaxID=3040011 RepID=UPI0011319C73
MKSFKIVGEGTLLRNASFEFAAVVKSDAGMVMTAHRGDVGNVAAATLADIGWSRPDNSDGAEN